MPVLLLVSCHVLVGSNLPASSVSYRAMVSRSSQDPVLRGHRGKPPEPPLGLTWRVWMEEKGQPCVIKHWDMKSKGKNQFYKLIIYPNHQSQPHVSSFPVR